MIKLTPATGAPLYINPNHLMYFYELRVKGVTRITCTEGQYFDVQEKPERIRVLYLTAKAEECGCLK